MSDLFSDAARERMPEVAPLALRMRPRTLDEFVGQRHVLGDGRRCGWRSRRTASAR